MAILGTTRLKVENGSASVTKLWNGRYRLEFLCNPSSDKTDWYHENIGGILPDFTANQEDFFGSGVDEGWEAIPDSVYPNMVCVEAEYRYIPSINEKRVSLAYETLTGDWVQEKDDTTNNDLNGLERVTRVSVALPETAYAGVIGTTTIEKDGTTLYLGKSEVDETDAKWTLTEEWFEHGELSRSEDLEDPKGAITITNLGDCPVAPDGYTAVKTSEDNTQGLPTCTVTFYKDDSVLSRSNDYVGSQLAEMIEVFNPTTQPTPTNGSAVLGSKVVSNVDGIPTTRYTFLVPSILSESEDMVGSQKAITIEAFDEVPATPTGYVIANEQVSDVEGIPTRRYTFLKPSILSQSSDKVGSQLAITIEAFSEIPSTPAGYDLANTRESDVEGIPTKRYTFLKPSVLSETKDYIGSQLAISIEAFSEVPSTPAGYELASEQTSDFEGIPTRRYTFLKPSVLSETKDYVGSQLAISIEAFSEIPSTPVGYSLANETTSDFEGIPTRRYTFLKDDVQLSSSEDYVGSQLSVSQQWFNPSADKTLAGYSLASKNVGDFEGIETVDYRFLKDDVELSRSEDYIGSQLAITIEQFNGTPTTPVGYEIANKRESDVEGIPTTRYTFLKPSVLSRSEDYVGSQLAITIEAFSETPVTPAGYKLAKEQVSDFEGIPTTRHTFLKSSILRLSTSLVGGVQNVSVSAFSMTSTEVINEFVSELGGHLLIDESEGDYEGIPTRNFVYEVADFSVRSRTASGLLRVTQTEISLSNFTDGDIGTDAALFDDGTLTATNVTLLLASSEVDNGNTVKKRVRMWQEQGKLSEADLATGTDRIRRKSVTWFGEAGTPPSGYVAASSKSDNTEGYPTTTVIYFYSTDLSQEFPAYTTTVPFTIPGTVGWRQSDLASGTRNKMVELKPPASTLCEASVVESYTTNPDAVDMSAVYQPSFWTNVIIEGVGLNYSPFSSSSTYVNYIAVSSSTSSTGPLVGTEFIQGNRLFGGTKGWIRIDGPTYDPSGNTIIVNDNASPIFTLLDGTQYYKRAVTTIDVPSRS